jgi:hypothetical protein
MSEYRTKSESYKAYDVRVEKEWPQWLTDAYNTGSILRDGAGRIYVRDTPTGMLYPLGTPFVDCWILMDERGVLKTMDDPTFQGLYEKVSD